jgi:(1->4)-alpha-D-glucan 1-alpha-D-glucosylmutase
MPVTDHDALDALCIACGIATAYHDIWGNYHQPGTEAKQALLTAIGLAIHDDDDIRQAIKQKQLDGWNRIVPTVLVARENESPICLTLTLQAVDFDKAIHWTLNQESGEVHHGDWNLDASQAKEECNVGGRLLKRFEVTLPCSPDCGYHQLIITSVDQNETQATLIMTPQSCYQPEALNQGRQLWGISLQLYALRSSDNWGIGDFADLHTAIDSLAPLGVNIIGLNPLHALFPHLPEQASPYSPTSRDFLNPIYLSIEAIDDFEDCEKIQQLVASNQFQTRLANLRDTELVDYTSVWSAKLEALQMLYRSFRQAHIENNTTRAKSFRQFQAEGGSELENFGRFEALQADFHRQDASISNWLSWPEIYHEPNSEAVKLWADSNHEEIEFYQYLQWNTELQLAEVQKHCARLGMTIGIYRDLAVGVTRQSEQTWAAQQLYALDSGIGAPPDDFNLHGQDWSLPPPKPQALIKEAYGPFVKTLRANMRHSGAIRIDHVMGLMRLFWVPPNQLPESGSYIAYPFADLLGILALESQRNQCMVIGEDLGTVPDECRAALQSTNVLSYRILYFEKNWQQGNFNSPQDYPRHAVASVGSHDLPTFSGFWQESDLDLNETLGLFPSPQHRDQQRRSRAQDKIEIVAALRRENLIPAEDFDQGNPGDYSSSELIVPVHRYLARSKTALMLVQLEDLFGQTEQINLPGTVDQHPNWRRKLPFDIVEWLNQGDLVSVAQAITRERQAPEH